MGKNKYRKILLTRPQKEVEETAAILTEKGCDVLCNPLMDISYKKEILNFSMDDYAGLIFTSHHGVQGFIQNCKNCDNRELPVFTVGDKTMKDVQGAGFKNVQSASGAVDDLIALLAQNPSDKPYFYVRGAHISQPLKGVIEGVAIEEKILYHADIKEEFSDVVVRAFERGEISDVLFYSKRTAQAFVDIIQAHKDPEIDLKSTNALCLGRSMLEYVSVLPWQDIKIANHPDQESLIALLDN